MVSIIIPIHNSAAYLRQCLDSLLAQSYSDFEAIIVDDSSTDSSPDMVRQLSSHDARFRLLEIPKSQPCGVSAARNMGLRNVNGEYFLFLDSDDALHPQALNIMVHALREHPQTSMALCSHIEFPDGTAPRFPDISSKQYTIVSGKKAAITMLHQTHLNLFHHSPWAKLFRTSLRSILSFPEGKIYEDLAAIPPLTASQSSIITIDSPLYAYRVRSDSLIAAIHPRRMQALEVALSLRRALSPDPQLHNAATDRLFAAAFNIFLLTSPHPKYRYWHHRSRRILRILRRSQLKRHGSRLRNRLGAIATFIPGLTILASLMRLSFLKRRFLRR